MLRMMWRRSRLCRQVTLASPPQGHGGLHQPRIRPSQLICTAGPHGESRLLACEQWLHRLMALVCQAIVCQLIGPIDHHGSCHLSTPGPMCISASMLSTLSMQPRLTSGGNKSLYGMGHIEPATAGTETVSFVAMCCTVHMASKMPSHEQSGKKPDPRAVLRATLRAPSAGPQPPRPDL